MRTRDRIVATALTLFNQQGYGAVSTAALAVSCGIAEGHVLLADPTGAGSVDLTIHTGAFANGVCDAQHACTVLVNDSGLLDKDAFVYFPITFAG